MYWVIQENVFAEDAYTSLVTTLERGQIPYTIVKFIPFTHKLIDHTLDITKYENTDEIPEIIVPDGYVIVMGATLMNIVAKERGWNPGTFHNENHSYLKCIEHWGQDMLNHDAVIGNLSEIEIPWKDIDIFVRPCYDTKAFNGQIIHSSEFNFWKNTLLSSGRDPEWLGKNTKIVVAPVKEIYAEYRFFIVDGKIVTSSMYKLGNRLCPDEYVAPIATHFVENMIKVWQPARGFVIDVAETRDGFKIIEVNTLNSSGFYKCRVGRIVMAVEEMSI